MESATGSGIEIVSEIGSHAFSAGGKRIRPALVILSAGACGGDTNDPRVIKMAAAVELIHTASLLHDDVVDAADARRGVSTTNSLWGNTLSVLGGDFLLSKAFSLLADVDVLDILSVLSEATVSMAESEMLQATCEGNIDAWRAEYWRIVKGKTAALMAACCECGAILAGADGPARLAFREYGTSFGLAFQITDDILDIAGDPERTGKHIGADLMSGKFTLPVLLACEKGSAVTALVGHGPLTAEDARRASALVIESGAADEARRVANDYGIRARQALAVVPRSEYSSALKALADSLATRDL